jgi:hypothetical protein
MTITHADNFTLADKRSPDFWRGKVLVPHCVASEEAVLAAIGRSIVRPRATETTPFPPLHIGFFEELGLLVASGLLVVGLLVLGCSWRCHGRRRAAATAKFKTT